MSLISDYMGKGPHPGQTMEDYEKQKIKEMLRLMEQAKHPGRHPTGLIIPGVPTEEDKIRREADRIYKKRHQPFGVKGMVVSRKRGVTK